MRFFPILLLSAAAGTSFAAISSQQQPPQKPTPQSQPSSPAQKPTPQSQPSSQNPASRGDASQSFNKHDDAFLALWVLTINNNEVTLSQIAQQKAQSDEVKQFAQKMITDHQAAATKLQQFTSGPGVGSHPVGGLGEEHGNPGSVAGSGNQPGSSGSGTSSGTTGSGSSSGSSGSGSAQSGTSGTGGSLGQQPGRPIEAGAGRMEDLSGHLDPIALITELGRQCLETSRTELTQKQGLEFDRCYMNMAVGMHMAMNDMLTVFQNHASGELRTTLADAQRSVQLHLEQAKQIAKRLDNASPNSSTPTSQPGSR